VDPKELERVKAFVRAARINQIQGSLGRAQLLGQFELFDGDAGRINREMDRFMAVTPEQIQAAAKKYLVPAKRTVLDIVPAPKAQGAKEGE
jgi:zinc protease